MNPFAKLAIALTMAFLADATTDAQEAVNLANAKIVNPWADVRAMSLPVDSFAAHMQSYCLQPPDPELQYFVCTYVAASLAPLNGCKGEVEGNTCMTPEELIADCNAYLKYSPGRTSPFEPRGNMSSCISQPGPGRQQFIKNQLDLIKEISAHMLIRSKCAGDLDVEQQGQSRFCSVRTRVQAVGDPGVPEPSCDSRSLARDAEVAMNLIQSAAATGPEAPTVFVMGLATEVIRSIVTADRGHGQAACAVVCAVVPPNYQIVRVQGFVSNETDGPMLKIPEGDWGNVMAGVRWDPGFEQASGTGGTAVCKRFRNWKERWVRDAQIAVFAVPQKKPN